MLFFKRILNFKRAALAKLRDKRKAERYPVGAGLPLKGVVNLQGLEGAAKLASAAAVGSGREWGGQLANLSISGASLLLPPAAVSTRGENTVLVLSLEKHSVQIPCVVAHFRAHSSHAVCGLALQFADFTTQKAYLQLLEAVIIGATLAPVKASAFQRPPSGQIVEQYRAGNKARLAVWREASSREINSFELVLGEHCLRGEVGNPALEVYTSKKGSAPAKTARSVPSFNLSTEVAGEVCQLYRWIVPNLTKEVPADLRVVMKRFAAAPPDWRPPPSSPTRLVVSPAERRTTPAEAPVAPGEPKPGPVDSNAPGTVRKVPAVLALARRTRPPIG